MTTPSTEPHESMGPATGGGPWTLPNWWRGTHQALTDATGLHPDAYVCPEFFADEQRQVFERAWVGVGLSAEATPGRLLVRTMGHKSIVITRDHDGRLSAFLNACRHRGTELAAEDCGIASTIRCPYHRWGYSLDGTLVAAPWFNDVPRNDFDMDQFRLVPVRIDEWGSLLFACLDPTTPPLLDWLGDLPQRMAGYELSSWQPTETLQLDIAANWKLITENYQEYYHLQWVHPELAKVSRVADHYRYQGPGMYCGQTTTPVSADSRDDWLALPPKAGLDTSDAVSGRFVAIFPNIMLSVLPNHVFVMRLEPLGAGASREICSWLLPQGSSSQSTAYDATRQFWLDVNNEDIDICQRSQRGLARGGVLPGPLSPRFEEPLHRFHKILAAHMLNDDLLAAVPGGDDAASIDDRWGTGANPTPPRIDSLS